jgi:Amt family ammonium transporter
VWYLVGYGVAYGGNNWFIGGIDFHGHFALSGVSDTGATHAHGYDWVSFLFQYCFCAACATIVSGAVAERCDLVAYLAYCIVIIGFIYPVVVHWVWDSAGFLCAWNPKALMGGMVDFAGSGVVHMTGGWAAMVGAKAVGPRLGRFERGLPAQEISGHSAALQVLGTFFLWFGWYGFNPGSALMIHGYAKDAARAAVTTTLSAAGAAVTGLYIKRLLPPKLGGTPGVWDLSHTCNSLLGGLVGVTAGTSVVSPLGAIIIGFLSAWVYHGASCLMRKVKIDDPLDAFAVHGACGAWGCVAVGFFTVKEYSYAGSGDFGIFYGGKGTLLAIQIIGVLLEIAWVVTTTGLLFPWLNGLRILRLKPEVEIAGADISKHGGSAYPVDTDDPDNSAHGGVKFGGLNPESSYRKNSAQVLPYSKADDGPILPSPYPPNDPRSKLPPAWS